MADLTQQRSSQVVLAVSQWVECKSPECSECVSSVSIHTFAENFLSSKTTIWSIQVNLHRNSFSWKEDLLHADLKGMNIYAIFLFFHLFIIFIYFYFVESSEKQRSEIVRSPKIVMWLSIFFGYHYDAIVFATRLDGDPYLSWYHMEWGGGCG